jgi:hypothetical protein
MKESEEQMFRTYAWDYFAYHADQRMKTFNFFIVAAGLLAGGITSLLKDGSDARWIIIPLGLLLFILSVVFWKLDQRNKALVRNGEESNQLPGRPTPVSNHQRDSQCTKDL